MINISKKTEKQVGSMIVTHVKRIGYGHYDEDIEPVLREINPGFADEHRQVSGGRSSFFLRSHLSLLFEQKQKYMLLFKLS